jgi:hypothetical protein
LQAFFLPDGAVENPQSPRFQGRTIYFESTPLVNRFCPPQTKYFPFLSIFLRQSSFDCRGQKPYLPAMHTLALAPDAPWLAPWLGILDWLPHALPRVRWPAP